MLSPAEYRLRIILKSPDSIQHVRELDKMEGVGVGGGHRLSEILSCAEVKYQDDTGIPSYGKNKIHISPSCGLISTLLENDAQESRLKGNIPQLSRSKAMLISHCHCHHLLPSTLQEDRSQRPLAAFPRIGQHLHSDNQDSQLSCLIRTIQLPQDALICVSNTKEIIRLQYNGPFSFPQVSFVSEGQQQS